ncbi:MAG TPA: DUF3303 family protein [Candidatus Udaeobacter sp.]|nr:DUF3303 family protein [Candidatus Udaeobacter sp.]
MKAESEVKFGAPSGGSAPSRQALKIMNRYMVVEHFAPGAKSKIYERFHEKGRMLPTGLVYIDSWLEKDGNRCFQLMETSDRSLFDVWIDGWKDLARFEIVELGEKPKKEA